MMAGNKPQVGDVKPLKRSLNHFAMGFNKRNNKISLQFKVAEFLFSIPGTKPKHFWFLFFQVSRF
jgi:hypothetical protein